MGIGPLDKIRIKRIAEARTGDGCVIKHLAGLRFYYYCVLQGATMASFAAGGWWMWLSVALLFGATVLADEGIGDYEPSDENGRSYLYNLPLYLSAFLAFAMAMQFSAIVGVSLSDPFGLADRVAAAGFGLVNPQPLWAIAGGAIALGMHFGAVAGNVGHEFCHRLNNGFSVSLSQWIFALPVHTSFPVEHVGGHHRNVGTREDPTTARRGESYWAYAVRSVSGTYRNAWALECDRSLRKDFRKLSMANRVVSGVAKQIVIVLCAFLIAGPAGAAIYLASALIGILILEQFNYISHYGLTRVPGTPIRPHHSWSSARVGSSSFMFNITRHSAHHAAAGTPYWDLSYGVRGPVYPYGPFVMVVLALVPPLFRAVVAPAVADWDTNLASDKERELAETPPRAHDSFPVAA